MGLPTPARRLCWSLPGCHYLPVGWIRLLASRGFFLAPGTSAGWALGGESSAAGLGRTVLLGTELLRGRWLLSRAASGDGNAGAVWAGRCRLAECSARWPGLFLAHQPRAPSSRRSTRYTSSAASFTRSNWTSSTSRTESRCWMSAATSEPSRALGARLSPSSCPEEVEARELSEVALGVGPSSDWESWLEEREGRGSIPSKRTLWRNCGGQERAGSAAGALVGRGWPVGRRQSRLSHAGLLQGPLPTAP